MPKAILLERMETEVGHLGTPCILGRVHVDRPTMHCSLTLPSISTLAALLAWNMHSTFPTYSPPGSDTLLSASKHVSTLALCTMDVPLQHSSQPHGI